MQSKLASSLSGTAAMSMLCLTSPVTAQDASERIAEIIVTARRVEERLQDVPISMSVFTQQQLVDRNITVASDLATFTPSLTSNTRFGAERSSFAIRGFTQETGTSPSVGVYFADAVALRVAGASTSGNGAGVGSYFDLQTVQVLKGPQGTLFGRNTTGGAVLLVPNKPTDQFEGYVEGSTGNYDMWRGQSVVNIPLSDSVRFRFGIDRQNRSGYVNNKSSIGPRDFNDINYTSLRASMVADLTPNLENYVVGYYSDSDSNGPMPRLYACQQDVLLRPASGVLIDDAGCAQVARQNARGDGYFDAENGVPNARQHIEQWQFINTTTWRVTDTLTLKNIASYGEYHESTTQSVFGDNLSLPAVLNLVNAGSVIPVPTGALAGTPYYFTFSVAAPGGELSAQSTLTEELQLQGSAFDSRLDWQVGAYAELSDPIGFTGSRPPTLLNCSDPDNFMCTDILAVFARRSVGLQGLRLQKNEFRNYGAYTQATYKLTDQWSLTGGLRYTWDRNELIQRQLTYRFTAPPAAPGLLPGASFCSNLVEINPVRFTTNPADCDVTYTQKSEKPTWLIDLDYKPIDDLLLYGKYARGYRQGAANPLAAALVTFEPEKVDSYELGAKTTFDAIVDGAFNIAVFYNDFTGQQLQVGVTPRDSNVAAGTVIVNAGKSRIQGVELDATVFPFEGFQFDVGYTYLDTKLLSFDPPDVSSNPIVAAVFPTIIVGKPLTQSPKHKFFVTSTYTLPLNENFGRISLGATFTHTDSNVSNYTPELQTYANPLAVVPATDLLNLNVNWNSVMGLPLDLSLFGTNVTAEEYPTFVGGTLPIVGYDSYGLAEPRMYGIRVKARFGN